MTFKIHPKEKPHLIFLTLVSLALYGFVFFYLPTDFTKVKSIVFSMLFLFFLETVMTLYFVGKLRGNGIKINKMQFPDIYEVLESHAKKLGFQKSPDMYVLQGSGVLNAFALRFIKRDYVVVNSGVLEMAYQEGKGAVSFIIGHELGHIKRKHTGFFKAIFLLPVRLVPFLDGGYSRACEYTADNIGHYLCPEGALSGILILASGKELYKKINVNELIWNAQSEQGFAVSFAEILSTHPVLVKRIANINQLNRDNLTPENHFFVSPKIDIQELSKN